MILLGLKVSIGQLLTLRNERTGEEVACRVVYLSPHESEKRQVGVDFMNPCPRFWRISFPPPERDFRPAAARFRCSVVRPGRVILGLAEETE